MVFLVFLEFLWLLLIFQKFLWSVHVMVINVNGGAMKNSRGTPTTSKRVTSGNKAKRTSKKIEEFSWYHLWNDVTQTIPRPIEHGCNEGIAIVNHQKTTINRSCKSSQNGRFIIATPTLS